MPPGPSVQQIGIKIPFSSHLTFDPFRKYPTIFRRQRQSPPPAARTPRNGILFSAGIGRRENLLPDQPERKDRPAHLAEIPLDPDRSWPIKTGLRRDYL